MSIRKSTISEWNEQCIHCSCPEDVGAFGGEVDIACCGDLVFTDGRYYFLLQNVGELNNVAMFTNKGNGSSREVIHSIADFFAYLVGHDIADSIFVIGGKKHNYDFVYRFFPESEVIKEPIGYFISLKGNSWRKFCRKE